MASFQATLRAARQKVQFAYSESRQSNLLWCRGLLQDAYVAAGLDSSEIHPRFIAVCAPRLRVVGLAERSEDLALAGSEQGGVHLRGRKHAKGKNEPVYLTCDHSVAPQAYPRIEMSELSGRLVRR